ncbi:MAG: ECF transporter S component [Acidobacteriota bacterium]|nr:ECF transporter S component [Acidobacteriota bacterium]
MSWPLASFSLVAGALLIGWLAYERSRPSARTVAVVATLAALTALGRDAFVALPEVKPITAMTLVSGYALGPLAGFMVGAVGMLSSNLLLGEGPYTPWQMAAWGLVGLLGALLGRISGRRLGRLPLALASAGAALMAKEVMNLYVWSLGGIYTPAALLARVGEGLPFDLVNVVSSFLFALAFAPELARLLGRVRERMTVRWEAAERAPAALAAVIALGAPGVAALAGLRPGAYARAAASNTADGVRGRRLAEGRAQAAAATAPSPFGGAASTAITNGVAYLRAAQNPDGGFPASPGERSSSLYSGWAALALAAAGVDPALGTGAKRSVLESIRATGDTLEGSGDVERTMLALAACGAEARKIGHVGLEDELLAAARADGGAVGGQVNLTAFAVLALRAAGHPQGDPAVRAAVSWLLRQQGPDGGFSYAARSGGSGAPSDVDDTGAVLEALAAGGVSAGTSTVRGAVAYLRSAQSRGGGFPQQRGQEPDAQSTAWAVQGLIAAGVAPQAVRVGAGAASPIAYLERLQLSSGAFRYSPSSEQTPVWVTAEVLPALAGRPLPIAAPEPVAGSAGAPAGAVAGRSGPSRAGGASKGGAGAIAPAPARTTAASNGHSPAGPTGSVGAWFPRIVAGMAGSLESFGRRSVASL